MLLMRTRFDSLKSYEGQYPVIHIEEGLVIYGSTENQVWWQFLYIQYRQQPYEEGSIVSSEETDEENETQMG